MKTKKMMLTVSSAVMLVSAGAADTDWEALNASALEQSLAVVAPGEPGKQPFWNGSSKAFIHPPAFEFTGGTAFTLTDSSSKKVAEWTAKRPIDPIPSEVWKGLKPGHYTVSNGTCKRRFYRAAVFEGPYAPAARSYADAVSRCDEAVFKTQYVQGWLKPGAPKAIVYDLYSYPSKIMGALIGYLADYSKASADRRDQAIEIAKKMADWLIANRQPAGSPLQYFTPTYSLEACANPRGEARKYAGNHMMIYPAEAACNFLKLHDALAENDPDRAKYFDAALKIALQYAAMQEADGTWAIVYREADGSKFSQQRFIPEGWIFGLLDDLIKRLDPESAEHRRLVAVRKAAFDYVDKSIRPAFLWNGQFEDATIKPDYVNLQHGNAITFALQLFRVGRTEDACALVDWCEDQFVVWSAPCPDGIDFQTWRTPTALEQYDYYTAIDGSMCMMIKGFLAAYQATGKALYLEKARALADNLTRGQRPDGTIPTYFSNRRGSDWINCMLSSREVLSRMSKYDDRGRGKRPN